MRGNIPLNGSAVLVWLPEGVKPTDDDFDPRKILAPPVPNPEPWWYAGEAIQHAALTLDTYSKVPWIKIGEILLDLKDIREIASHLPPNYRG